ncbi:Calmodulin [Dictyocoela muelleri]|nr:Calmodulin [Dictyocoela muelleri]
MITPEKQRKIFNLFSQNGDHVQKKDIHDMLRYLGYVPTKLDIKNDKISYDEFLEICKNQPFFNKEELLKSFEAFDHDNDGNINVKELFEILDHGDDKFTKHEKEEIMNYLSTNLSGVINYKNFISEI